MPLISYELGYEEKAKHDFLLLHALYDSVVIYMPFLHRNLVVCAYVHAA